MPVPLAIREWAEQHPTAEPRGLALKILPLLGQDELIDLVTEAVVHAQRRDTRETERTALSGGTLLQRAPLGQPVPATRPVLPAVTREAFQRLLTRTFVVEASGHQKGRVVSWGAATIADHQLRVFFLRKTVTGIQLTMSYHEQAIEVIEKAGVRCLDDLPELAQEKGEVPRALTAAQV